MKLNRKIAFRLSQVVRALGERTHHALLSHMSRNGLIAFAEGGTGDGKPTITPEIQALIDAQVAEKVSGLKAKNEELILASKDLKERVKQFEGIDPKVAKSILQRFANDEEAQLIAEGKIDQVLERRTEAMKTDYEKRLKDASESAEAANRRATAYESRVLDDAIRAAAAKAGLHAHAIDDALLRAKSVFRLSEDGKAVALGEDGKPILGKDGKTPFELSEWLDSMKEKAPHWFPVAASGMGGTKGLPAGAAGLKRSTMTLDQRSKFIAEHGRETYMTLPA